MDQLLAWLPTLGPWGVAAAAVLYVLLRRSPAPVIPGPTPAPSFPLLDRLAQLFRLKAAGDLPAETLVAVRLELDKLATVHADRMTASLNRVLSIAPTVSLK